MLAGRHTSSHVKEGCNSDPYSGALRSAPEEAKKTPEHSGNLRKIFRRKYLRKASGGEISTPEASGSLPDYSRVVLNQLRSPPECFFRRIPEDHQKNSGTLRRKPKRTPEHSGSLRKSFQRRYFLQASGGEISTPEMLRSRHL